MKHLDFDVAVIGGGPAGICAAIAAARAGAHVVLVEQYGFLGGMATAGFVTPVSEFRKNGRQVIGGIAWELMERMHALGGARLDYPSGNVPFDGEIYKLAAQRMVLEAGISLLLHAKYARCRRENARIVQVEAIAPGGALHLRAHTFIDSTSDAALAWDAGAPMQAMPTGALQPATLEFRLAGVDTQALSRTEPREENTRYYQAEIQSALLRLRENGVGVPVFGGPWLCTVLHEGTVNVNITRLAVAPGDALDMARAECELREQAFCLSALLKAHFPPFRNSYIQATAVEVGLRETRRIRGAHTLTGEELLRAQPFVDAIARCAHPVDIHHVGDEKQSVQFLPEAGYIPYRCLYVPEILNLLVTGRAISTDRMAFASTRVQATAMAVGQAAGVAAALCAGKHRAVDQVEYSLLRTSLQRQKAIV